MKNNWALVGLGFISPRHVKGIDAIGDIILATCDIDPTRGADFLSFDKLRASNMWKRISHVAVCTPNDTHHDIVRASLDDGKRVLCEKPLTIFDDFSGLEDVNVVLQLRCNPAVQVLKAEGVRDVSIKVVTYREQKYWDSWKGRPERSGGVLLNMGVHYIDLLIHLLGEPVEILETTLDLKYKATGRIRFQNGIGEYHIELSKEPCETIRDIRVNGRREDIEGATIPLSDSTNMQYKDLHSEVYREFIAGRGIPLEEARRALDLISDLYA